MQLRYSCRYPCVLMLATMMAPVAAFGQSATWHLHKEASKTGGGVLQLKPAGPDAGAATQPLDLKNRPVGVYVVKAFDTAVGSPNVAGVVPAGSSVSFVLWMRKTTAAGVMYPQAKVSLNSAAGAALCEATGSSPLTTTVSAFNLACTTATNLTMAASDRLYLSTAVSVTTAPGNTALKAELRLEGALNGNYDSRIVVPSPVTPPVVSSIAPASGPSGTVVTIGGSNFGASQGSSTVLFNNLAASVTTWAADRVTAVVPAAAASGPVTVRVSGLSSNGLPFTVLEPEAAGPVRYAYDAIGRLIETTTASGQSAIYRYDPAGNILAIDRPGTDGGSAVSIAGFLPTRGGVGTAVSIDGAGFSSVTNENAVTFGGVPAAVAAATGTQLLATVPPGAVTGPIGVTSPAGAATSATAFTVLADSGAPTITGFSPQIGVTGTPFTITGTNFETAKDHDRVTLNVKVADVTAATSSTLATSVPLASMGGRISLTTPFGAVVTSADFVVVPAPYTPADVDVAVRVTTGESRSATVNTAGHIALVLFDGTAGRKISITSVSSSWTACQAQYGLTVYTPDAAVLKTVNSACGGSTLIDQQTLPSTGTYTLMLDPFVSYTGSATVTVHQFDDVTGTITPNGPAVPASITTPGQNARFTFAGTAGQLVSALVPSATYPFNCSSYSFYLMLLRPDGSTQAYIPSCGGGVFLDRQTLSTAGTYTVMIDAIGTAVGDASLQLFTFEDVTGPAEAGMGIPATITTPGQNGRFTFSGTPGQMVSGWVTGATIPGNCNSYAFYLMLVRPDGSTQAYIPSCGGSVFLDRQTLSAAGTYTLLVDPIGANTGSATVTLYNVVDVTGPIAINGASVPVSLPTPGQNAVLTFAGTAGQVVTVSTANNTIPGNCFSYAFQLTLVKPDGAPLATAPSCSNNISLGQRTLPTTGTYTIRLDPYEYRTGSIAIVLTSP